MTIYDEADAIVQGDFRCDGNHEIIIAHAGYVISLVNAQNLIDTMYADLPNIMDIGDMLLADVTGDGRLDIVLVNTYAGVIVLQNNTAIIAADTLISASHLISGDTIVLSQYDSTINLRDTVYTAGDTIVAKIIALSITYHEQDTLRSMIRSGLTFLNCRADTVFFMDTINIVSTFITSDSVYATVGSDTIINPGTGNQTLKIKVYPNPFTSGVNIEGGDNTAIIRIYDQMGSLVLSQSCGGSCFISANNLPQGIYTTVVSCSGKIFRNKIVSLSSF
jgi:hypothetical protein